MDPTDPGWTKEHQEASEAAHEDKMREEPPTLGEAIDKAAGHLPEGYQIIINIGRGGYAVALSDKYRKEKDIDGGDGILSDINEAICIANGFTA